MLQHIDFTNCNLNPTSAYFIFTTLDKCHSLKNLILDQNEITFMNPKAILHFLRGNRRVEYLSMAKCRLEKEVCFNTSRTIVRFKYYIFIIFSLLNYQVVAICKYSSCSVSVKVQRSTVSKPIVQSSCNINCSKKKRFATSSKSSVYV